MWLLSVKSDDAINEKASYIVNDLTIEAQSIFLGTEESCILKMLKCINLKTKLFTQPVSILYIFVYTFSVIKSFVNWFLILEQYTSFLLKIFEADLRIDLLSHWYSALGVIAAMLYRNPLVLSFKAIVHKHMLNSLCLTSFDFNVSYIQFPIASESFSLLIKVLPMMTPYIFEFHTSVN